MMFPEEGTLLAKQIDKCDTESDAQTQTSLPAPVRIRKTSRDLYQNQLFLTEQDFLSTTQTGDILLMKTNTYQCSLQRLVTNSQYDHVSMVVKFQDNSIKIFESNADEGVQLYNWNEFQCKFNCYEKICLRRLHHEANNQPHSLLVPFIKKTIGSKYSLGAIKLIRKTSEDSNPEQHQDFFCSELVAKAYKQMKLLKTDKGSQTFWPVDFTMRGALALEAGAYLGLERLILLKRDQQLE